jgi:hypothetical protein
MSRPWLPPASLNGASVIKRTEIFSDVPSPPAERPRAAVPPVHRVPPGSTAGMLTGERRVPPGLVAAPGTRQVPARARRRTRRAPDALPVPLARPAAPLPDPAMVGLFAVPDPAPPYDDESLASAAGHGSGYADRAPAGAESAGPQPSHGKPGRPRDDHPDPPGQGVVPPGRQRHATDTAEAERSPDAVAAAASGRAAGITSGAKQAQGSKHTQATWPNLFAQILAETLAGSRPARQLSPWTTQQARTHIRRLGPLLRASREPQASGAQSVTAGGKRPIGGSQPRVRRVVASMPSADVVEMAVVVRFGRRVRALAVRLEQPDGKEWICTAIEAA